MQRVRLVRLMEKSLPTIEVDCIDVKGQTSPQSAMNANRPCVEVETYPRIVRIRPELSH